MLDGQAELSWPALCQLVTEDPVHPEVLEHLRQVAATRYQEGYQKGVHDEDALRITTQVVSMQASAGLLAWGPTERALALLYWQHGESPEARAAVLRRLRAAWQMRQLLGQGLALSQWTRDLALQVTAFMTRWVPDLLADADEARQQTTAAQAAAYLAQQLMAERGTEAWVIAGAGEDLAQGLVRELERHGRWAECQRDLAAATPAERWRLCRDWARAWADSQGESPGASPRDWVDDAASQLAVSLPRLRQNATLDAVVTGLRADHPASSTGG